MKELGERLRAIVDFVDPGSRVADVGCDHAYVSIELAKEKNCTCIAMDIKEGPLKSAEENIREAEKAAENDSITGKITTRLSDGLTELAAGEVDTILIAGMGGHLILDILKNGASKIQSGMKLVLSPQSDLRLVRYELRKMNIFIEKERCLEDGGKWYFVLKCTVGIKPPTPVPDEVARVGMLYGTYLPEHPTEEFRKFLVWEEQGLKDLLQSLSKQKTPAAKARAGTMKKQLDENRAIQERISQKIK